MSNQSFVFNLKIKINENNEGEILYNNSSSKLKYAIFCYMNDKISCHTSLYNSYYNADIEVRKEEVTPITYELPKTLQEKITKDTKTGPLSWYKSYD